jgi:hypothetical protein
MNAKVTAALAALVLLACGLAGCGSKMPRTTSNVSICRVLASALDGATSPQELAGPTFETDAGLSRQLREDIGQYVAEAATGHGNSASAKQAAQKAETACRSIQAPVARAYGGSG